MKGVSDHQNGSKRPSRGELNVVTVPLREEGEWREKRREEGGEGCGGGARELFRREPWSFNMSFGLAAGALASFVLANRDRSKAHHRAVRRLQDVKRTRSQHKANFWFCLLYFGKLLTQG